MSQDLIDFLFPKIEEVPEGWYSVKDIAIKSGKTEAQVYSKLKRLHFSGEVECRYFYISAGRKAQHVAHYNLSNARDSGDSHL